MTKSNLDANFERIKSYKNDGCFRASVLFYGKINSFYDQKTGMRMIKKKDFTGRALHESDSIKGINKDNASSSISILKKRKYITEDDTKKYYIIHEPEGESFVSLKTSFARELIKKRPSDDVLVYIYLFRLFDIKRDLGKPACFTCKEIAVDVFRRDNPGGTIYEKIKDILAGLKNDGLIDYSIKKVELKDGGFTFVRRLLEVNQKFTSKEEIRNQEEGITGGKEDTSHTMDDVKEESIDNGDEYFIEKLEFTVPVVKGGTCEMPWNTLQSYISGGRTSTQGTFIIDHLPAVFSNKSNAYATNFYRKQIEETCHKNHVEIDFLV